jgi:hypothetical protein
MGALDDAIRDHLELKRKHGASEDEVASKEKDAHRVGALPSDASSFDSTEAPETETAPQAERVELEPEPSAEALLDELEPDEVLPEEALELEPTPASELEPPPTPEPAPPPASEPEASEVVEPGSSWTADEQPNGNRQSDDLLEETPEFLEDLPEQDRLWFDQRSPKDFDFGD